MSKSLLSWLAVALVLGGVAIVTGHPAWGWVTGCVLILFAGAAAGGAVWVGSKRQRKAPSGQRVANNLVALSAAAIVAVYAAGFYRTRAAADTFEAQAARRRTPPPILPIPIVPIAATAPAPQPAAQPATGAKAAPLSPVLSTVRRKHRDSTPRIRRATSGPTPTKAPEPDLTASISSPPPMAPAVTSTDPAAPPLAPAPAAGPTPAAAPAPKVHYHDGTFYGWGRSAHGDIRAAVVIKGGKIAATAIATCDTAYPCSWIVGLPGQVVTRQSANVHLVTGATDSSYAFQDAVTAALFRAQGG